MADKVVSLKISDYTSLNNAVSTEEGEKVNQYIREALKRADIVELDFSGIADNGFSQWCDRAVV